MDIHKLTDSSGLFIYAFLVGITDYLKLLNLQNNCTFEHICCFEIKLG